MNKTFIIISREYTSRIKKKSFIILTILLPILMAALVVLPVALVIHNENTQKAKVLVVDDTEIFLNAFRPSKNTSFDYTSGNIEQIKQEALNGNYDVVFHILPSTQALTSNLYYSKHLPANLQENLESQMNEIFFDRILEDTFKVDPAKFETIQKLTKARITTIQVDDEGNERENVAGINETIGMICGFFIYFTIIIFASQVLRGVLEEKTNRIVEVLISSVKPMQLLVGKIVGIALVGITQFAIWIFLTFGILFTVQIAAPNLFAGSNPLEMASTPATATGTPADTLAQLSSGSVGQTSAAASANIFSQISNYFSVSFTQIILCFLFFFIIGYLIYATLYAATGSVVDNESDSQQYTMPVTIPLILSIVLVPSIATNPNGQLAFWFSMIPLTSPITMMVRLPAGVPAWQLALSMGLSVLFLLFCIWFAAKIYRVGILMYGKKSSWKEIIRWLKKS